MRFRLRAAVLAGILALGGLTVATPSAHAQCGGGGSGGGGFSRAYGGHTFNPRVLGSSGGYSARYGCGGCGMMMGGMNMGGMQMPATTAPATSMPGMSMNGNAAPAASTPTAPAATTQYHCPMHPSVVASFPAKCPYCGMALTK